MNIHIYQNWKWNLDYAMNGRVMLSHWPIILVLWFIFHRCKTLSINSVSLWLSKSSGLAELHLQSWWFWDVQDPWTGDTVLLPGVGISSARNLCSSALHPTFTQSSGLQFRPEHVSKHHLKPLPAVGALSQNRKCRTGFDLGRSLALPRSLGTLCKPPPKGGRVCETVLANKMHK